MSELTRCNYCTWKDHLREAKNKGQRAILVSLATDHPFADLWPKGRRILIDGHDIGVTFAEVTDHCVC